MCIEKIPFKNCYDSIVVLIKNHRNKSIVIGIVILITAMVGGVYIIKCLWGSALFAFFGNLIIAGSTAWLGFKSFLTQQRISRFQKIYYEDFFVYLLNHLDNTMNITAKNHACFERALNFFKLYESYDLEFIKERMAEIIMPSFYKSSNREMLMSLFGQSGHTLYTWIEKFDHRHIDFNARLSELIKEISQKKSCMNAYEAIKNHRMFVERNYLLPRLFRQIVSNIWQEYLGSKNALINHIKTSAEIEKILEKIERSYKMLFGYYDFGNNTYVSFLVCENSRLKLYLDTEGRLIKKEPVDANLELDEKNLKIFEKELWLIELNDEGKYVNTQMRTVNNYVFDQKPDKKSCFYPEIPF